MITQLKWEKFDKTQHLLLSIGNCCILLTAFSKIVMALTLLISCKNFEYCPNLLIPIAQFRLAKS